MHHRIHVEGLKIHLSSNWIKNIAYVVLGSLLLTLSAKCMIPVWPVHGTLQTLVLPLLGVFLGARLGATAVALYLLEGAMGLPVFTGTPEYGLGLAYMMGPSAGYLLGFIPATYFMGYFYHKGVCQGVSKVLRYVMLSSLIVTIPGIVWLIYLLGMEVALSHFMSILPGSVAKICLATAMVYKHSLRRMPLSA